MAASSCSSTMESEEAIAARPFADGPLSAFALRRLGRSRCQWGPPQCLHFTYLFVQGPDVALLFAFGVRRTGSPRALGPRGGSDVGGSGLPSCLATSARPCGLSNSMLRRTSRAS
eukprot:4606368-Pleurochrysis_carterae.AAC.1